eukprot:2390119-Amphidinium_carterae.3
MATEKSVAAAALYLGVRLTVLHEDMAQAWTFLGEAGNPVGPSYILKLKAEHFTLGQQVDIQPHVLHGASWRFGQLPTDVQLLGGKHPVQAATGPWLQALRNAKYINRPRTGQRHKCTPWTFLHTNANTWQGAQKALAAAQYEHAVDVLTVAEHRLYGTALEEVKEKGQGEGWSIYATPCKRTGTHALATSGGVSIHVKNHIGSTPVEAGQDALEGRSIAVCLNIGKSKLTLMQVYGQTGPSEPQKIALVQALATWIKMQTTPWLILGDFNVEPHDLERYGLYDGAQAYLIVLVRPPAISTPRSRVN